MRTIYIVIATSIDRTQLSQLLSDLKAFVQSRGGSVSSLEGVDRSAGQLGGAEWDDSRDC